MARSDHHEELRVRLDRLHHQYKVLWTYYQTGQSLLRTLLKVRRLEDLGLDQVYERLTELEDELGKTEEPIRLAARIQEVEQQLQRAHYILTQFDNNMSPSITRRYIERLERYDPRFLIYLIQFLLSKYPMTQEDWDKVDLLLTKLAIVETSPGHYELRPERELQEMRRVITEFYEVPYVPPDRIRDLVNETQAIASEMRRVTEYQDLLERGLLARIRDYKKSVQHLMLHPQMMIPFLRLNLTTKTKFLALYQQEIDRIHAVLQSMDDSHPDFSLIPASTPAVAPRVSADLATSQDSEDFVQTLSHLKERMDHLTRMLQDLSNNAEVVEETGRMEISPVLELTPLELELADSQSITVPEELREVYENLFRVLNQIDWDQNLTRIAYSQQLQKYRFEPFEIEAYQHGFSDGQVPKVERLCYRLIFLGSLCRIQMSKLAREIIDRQRQTPDDWIAAFPNERVEEMRSLLDVAQIYESELSRWHGYADLPESLRRWMSRALRKLQRARVGLSLLYDQVEDEWAERTGQPILPRRREPRTVEVKLAPQGGPSGIITWLGWITALAMFILLLILIFTQG